MADRTCTVEGCEKPARHLAGRGWCSMHDERWRRLGSLDLTKPSPAERFAAKVDTSGGPAACHPWTGSRMSNGYPRFNPGGGPVLATRWLMGHLRGAALVRGEVVCHHCDNPPCVNPAHLFVGTASDNMQDCLAKGRHVTRSKLTPSDAAAIRASYARGGVSQAQLARQFEVGQSTIQKVVAGTRHRTA